MVIFHGYAELPEGIPSGNQTMAIGNPQKPPWLGDFHDFFHDDFRLWWFAS
jgi:hypothetical protein